MNKKDMIYWIMDHAKRCAISGDSEAYRRAKKICDRIEILFLIADAKIGSIELAKAVRELEIDSEGYSG